MTYRASSAVALTDLGPRSVILRRTSLCVEHSRRPSVSATLLQSVMLSLCSMCSISVACEDMSCPRWDNSLTEYGPSAQKWPR